MVPLATAPRSEPHDLQMRAQALLPIFTSPLFPTSSFAYAHDLHPEIVFDGPPQALEHADLSQIYGGEESGWHGWRLRLLWRPSTRKHAARLQSTRVDV
jgi:hypothetical protein